MVEWKFWKDPKREALKNAIDDAYIEAANSARDDIRNIKKNRGEMYKQLKNVTNDDTRKIMVNIVSDLGEQYEYALEMLNSTEYYLKRR